MILSAIAAMAKNRVIGVDNTLPWSLPEDMKFFRDMTKGKVMIMGRKTFESLGSPLPKRFHIVITRNESYEINDPNVQVVANMGQAMELAHMLTSKFKEKFGEEVMVIGGGEIYKQSLDLLDRIYLTVIDQDYPGDTKFPEFSEQDFKLVQESKRTEPIPFSFRTYEKISN